MKKIFIENNEGKLEPINFKNLLFKKLDEIDNSKNQVSFDSGEWGDGSGSWLEMYYKKKKKQLTLAFHFDDKGEKLLDFQLFITPIITLLDENNTKNIF